jgi:hypothetical protein
MARRSQPQSQPQSLIVVDGFYPRASGLRRHFDSRFADPRSADGARFI